MAGRFNTQKLAEGSQQESGECFFRFHRQGSSLLHHPSVPGTAEG